MIRIPDEITAQYARLKRALPKGYVALSIDLRRDESGSEGLIYSAFIMDWEARYDFSCVCCDTPAEAVAGLIRKVPSKVQMYVDALEVCHE